MDVICSGGHSKKPFNVRHYLNLEVTVESKFASAFKSIWSL